MMSGTRVCSSKRSVPWKYCLCSPQASPWSAHDDDGRVLVEAQRLDLVEQLLHPEVGEGDLVVVLLHQPRDARERGGELLVRHVRGVRLEQVRPEHEALVLARRPPVQARDHPRHDARRGAVLVRLGDRAGAVVGPLGEPAADPAIGREIEVREDPDRFETRSPPAPRRTVWFAGKQVGVVHRRLVEGDVGRVATGDDRGERARRVRRLRPDAPEVGPARGQRVEGRRQRMPGRAAVARDPQPIGAEGVDGDDEDVPLPGIRRAA